MSIWINEYIWDFVGHEQILVGQCPMTDSYLQPCIMINNHNNDNLKLIVKIIGKGKCITVLTKNIKLNANNRILRIFAHPSTAITLFL